MTFEKASRHYHWIILAIAILLSLLTIYNYRRRHKYDKLIEDLKADNKNQSIDMNLLQHNIDMLKISDDNLRNAVSSHMLLMRQIIEECYHTPNNTLSKSIRKIVNYQEDNKGLWERLYVYIDMEYNNIITDTRKKYPELSERDILLLALTCLGYSCAQIAVIMGYANATTIGGSRLRLAKKMKLNKSLKEYIEDYI